MKKKTTFCRFCLAVFIVLTFCFSVFAEDELLHGQDEEQERQMTKQQRLEKTLYLQDLNYAAALDGVMTVIEPEDKSVTPIYSSGVFYVPLRFVMESFRVEVDWDDSTKTVILKAGWKQVNLSVKDDTATYLDLSTDLDYDCFIKNGFTYIALDDVSKLIGCHTYFYSAYNAGVIAVGEEWNPDRDAEKQAQSAMEFVVSPFFKMFIK